MKYIELKPGDDFSLCGCLLRYVRCEKTEVVLYDIRKKKTFTYGYDALLKTVKQYGYLLLK